MNPKLRSVLIVLGILTLVFVGFFVIPRGVSLYYQIKGGQQVEYVLRGSQGIHELVCEQLPDTNEAAINEVEQAIVDLYRAKRFNKNNSQAYYYLGKANCLLGNPAEAAENFELYTQIRPKNPLGYIGLGFAYEELENFVEARSAWEGVDLNVQSFSAAGDEEFEAEQYEDSVRWYERAGLMGGELSAYSKFNWSVAAILSGNRFPTQLDPLEIPIYPLSGMLQIEGSELQWFRPEDKKWNVRYGQPLSEHPSGDPDIGGIWWRGAAVAVVHSPCTANYRIQVRAIHNSLSDKAGQLLFEDNLLPFATFIMSENWQDYDADVTLSKGYHLLGIRYVKDVGDVLVDRMRISQDTDCE